MTKGEKIKEKLKGLGHTNIVVKYNNKGEHDHVDGGISGGGWHFKSDQDFGELGYSYDIAIENIEWYKI